MTHFFKYNFIGESKRRVTCYYEEIGRYFIQFHDDDQEGITHKVFSCNIKDLFSSDEFPYMEYNARTRRTYKNFGKVVKMFRDKIKELRIKQQDSNGNGYIADWLMDDFEAYYEKDMEFVHFTGEDESVSDNESDDEKNAEEKDDDDGSDDTHSHP